MNNSWNMFSPEVSDMRTRISDYGGPAKYRRAPGHQTNSFKAQALLELASRLALEDETEQLRRRIASLINRVEELECQADIAGRAVK